MRLKIDRSADLRMLFDAVVMWKLRPNYRVQPDHNTSMQLDSRHFKGIGNALYSYKMTLQAVFS